MGELTAEEIWEGRSRRNELLMHMVAANLFLSVFYFTKISAEYFSVNGGESGTNEGGQTSPDGKMISE